MRHPARDERDDRDIIEYRAPDRVPVPFRPGLRALTAAAFAGALYFAFLTVVVSKKLQLPVLQMWTLYAAVALVVLGVLFFRLAYRPPSGGAG